MQTYSQQNLTKPNYYIRQSRTTFMTTENSNICVKKGGGTIIPHFHDKKYSFQILKGNLLRPMLQTKSNEYMG